MGGASKQKSLDTIVVLYRQDDTLTLWGIPYPMRDGQSPRMIGERWRDKWIYLGEPGWFYGTTERRLEIDAYLEKHKEYVPGGPHEWSYLTDDETEIAALKAKWGLL